LYFLVHFYIRMYFLLGISVFVLIEVLIVFGIKIWARILAIYFFRSLFLLISFLKLFKLFTIETKKLFWFPILFLRPITIIYRNISFKPIFNLLFLFLFTSTFNIPIGNFLNINFNILKTTSFINSQNRIFFT
jgi:hypothetical protein